MNFLQTEIFFFTPFTLQIQQPLNDPRSPLRRRSGNVRTQRRKALRTGRVNSRVMYVTGQI